MVDIFAWAPNRSLAAQVMSSVISNLWRHNFHVRMSAIGWTLECEKFCCGMSSKRRALADASSSMMVCNSSPFGSDFSCHSIRCCKTTLILSSSALAAASGCIFKAPSGCSTCVSCKAFASSCCPEPTLSNRRRGTGVSLAGSRFHLAMFKTSLTPTVGYLSSCSKYFRCFCSKFDLSFQSLPALLLKIFKNSAVAFAKDSKGVVWNWPLCPIMPHCVKRKKLSWFSSWMTCIR
mmetsp:Transcript_79176/g.214195  ORF Transcript_79176/g.214195 Transcript_79176/m.214195 type:complete len:234 (-) Transcript_79176:86-787(-)